MHPTDMLVRSGNDYASPDELAAMIVASYVGNNSLPQADLPTLFTNVRAAVVGQSPLSLEPEEMPSKQDIKKSICNDGLISFIDGKKYQTLKRHLTKHGLTPTSYRERYGLPMDYPIVAPGYSERRSALAKDAGLGSNRKTTAD